MTHHCPKKEISCSHALNDGTCSYKPVTLVILEENDCEWDELLELDDYDP